MDQQLREALDTFIQSGATWAAKDGVLKRMHGGEVSRLYHRDNPKSTDEHLREALELLLQSDADPSWKNDMLVYLATRSWTRDPREAPLGPSLDELEERIQLARQMQEHINRGRHDDSASGAPFKFNLMHLSMIVFGDLPMLRGLLDQAPSRVAYQLNCIEPLLKNCKLHTRALHAFFLGST